MPFCRVERAIPEARRLPDRRGHRPRRSRAAGLRHRQLTHDSSEDTPPLRTSSTHGSRPGLEHAPIDHGRLTTVSPGSPSLPVSNTRRIFAHRQAISNSSSMTLRPRSQQRDSRRTTARPHARRGRRTPGCSRPGLQHVTKQRQVDHRSSREHGLADEKFTKDFLGPTNTKLTVTTHWCTPYNMPNR